MTVEPPEGPTAPAAPHAGPPASNIERGGPGRAGLRRFLRWTLRWTLALLGLVVAVPVLYFGAAEIAMRITVDGTSEALEGSIDVYFFRSGPHVDVWVPAFHPEFTWREHLPEGFPLERHGYLAIGWGEREFYTKVPTWSDLTPGVAVRGALWPTPTAVRVKSYWGGPVHDDRCHLVRVEPSAYRELCEYILESAVLDAEGRMVRIDFEGYGVGLADGFFEGRGSYHALHTCNAWTNGALAAAGKDSAIWAPLPRGVLRQLPNNQGLPPK
ncbi:hypothetical protein Poly30_54550 [Planctomycetes bacterium Poly30]|uniref:DUF2459 domain-containing protein n=1 Tax=Saltatorellus ferox TaxID=2528018 RepID=A0A518F0P4_9BACT|nr:hypothetical protein Poly30_54550 [Planctomycetes bacterium Poly30]